MTLRIMAGSLGSMLWHWSSMYTVSLAHAWATGSASSRMAFTSSWAIRNSWYGSIDPTMRSSSPYFLSLRSNEAEPALGQQQGHDLLDVHAHRVVPGVDADARTVAQGSADARGDWPQSWTSVE